LFTIDRREPRPLGPAVSPTESFLERDAAAEVPFQPSSTRGKSKTYVRCRARPIRDAPRISYICLVQSGSSGEIARYRAKWLPGSGENPNYEYAIPLLGNTPKAGGLRKRDRERAEALRLAGGPKPSLRERAVALAQERGIVRTRELTDIGVPRCYLTRMCEEGLLAKVGHGRYMAVRGKVA
jgi:hypothetical protein